MAADYYKPGAWNAICDVCGFKFKSTDMKKRWDGFMVCEQDYELRNPQDFIKVPSERPAPAWTRPEEDTSGYTVCTIFNSVGVAGVGVAGCARTGLRSLV